MDHPAIAQVTTFGIPDAALGEDVAAAVVLRPGMAATAADIRQFAVTRLAEFKVPRRVLIVTSIPAGPTARWFDGSWPSSSVWPRLGVSPSS